MKKRKAPVTNEDSTDQPDAKKSKESEEESGKVVENESEQEKSDKAITQNQQQRVPMKVVTIGDDEDEQATTTEERTAPDTDDAAPNETKGDTGSTATPQEETKKTEAEVIELADENDKDSDVEWIEVEEEVEVRHALTQSWLNKLFEVFLSQEKQPTGPDYSDLLVFELPDEGILLIFLNYLFIFW